MVVAARRQEHGARHATDLLEPEHVAVEAERAIEVGHLQVHMADVDPRIDHGAILSVRGGQVHYAAASAAAAAPGASGSSSARSTTRSSPSVL